MHDSAPNIAECFRCSLLVYEWWRILQVSSCKERQGKVPYCHGMYIMVNKVNDHSFIFWLQIRVDSNVSFYNHNKIFR